MRKLPLSRFLRRAAQVLPVAATLLTGTIANAMKIDTVKSPGGIVAWLVEDHSLPLLTMQFSFAGGASQDPPDKPGVANFLTTMLDEGAGDLAAEAFQTKVEDLAARISFDAGRDNFLGSFQTLTENREPAAALLALALTKPRFDADAIARMRQQLSAIIAINDKDPSKVASQTWYRIAFPDHPYGRPVDGTAKTVGAIGQPDLEDFRARTFAIDTLRVSVVGDITPAALGPYLDKVFGGLANTARLRDVPDVALAVGPRQEIVAMDVPQSVVQFGNSGLARKDPDFIAASVLNYIIGGGGFGSRLTEEVREKRGLAYSVYTYLQPLRRAAIYLGGVATKNEAVATSLEVIRAELTRIGAEGPTAEELDDAKRYMTGSYALRFDSSPHIAEQLLGIQIEELGIDYVDRRNGLVDAVGIEDVRRSAKRILRPAGLIITIVGQPEKIGSGG